MTEDMSWLYEEIPGVGNGSSSETTPEDLNAKLRRLFDGRIVRKDLTKKIEGWRECADVCVGIFAGAVLQLG